MTEETKRAQMKEFFFAPLPKYNTRAIVIGSVVAAMGILMAISEAVGAGLAISCGGFLWAVLIPLVPRKVRDRNAESFPCVVCNVVSYGSKLERYRNRPPVDQMMKWLMEDIERLADDSREYLGIVEETGDPILVVGPEYRKDVRGIDPDMVLRRWEGDKYFYSTYRVTVFRFTEQFLGAYQATFNMIRNVTTEEQSDEFFYTDVVAVRTQSEASSYVLKTNEKLEHSKTFQLKVSSGDSVSVVIDDPKIKAGPELESLGDQAVKNIRAMLREYKQQARAS